MTVLASPPRHPLPEIDLPIPGGRLRQHADGLVELLYDGLPALPSWPHDTPEKRREAADVAGGDLFLANLHHEVFHTVVLPLALGQPYSPSLHRLAEHKAGLRETYHEWWGLEENAVLAIRLYAAVLGIDVLRLARRIMALDLVNLAVEAVEREERKQP